MMRLAAVLSLGACLLVACTPLSAQAVQPPPVLVTLDPNASPTPTPFQPAPAAETPVPVTVPSETPSSTESPTIVAPTPTAEDTATTAPPPPPPTPVPAAGRTQYTFYVTLDYAARAVAVNETIAFINNTGRSLESIVLAVEPNLWTNCFSMSELEQDGTALTSYTLSGQRLSISLPQALGPGMTTTFSLGYSLALPVRSFETTFGYRTDQINLTDWYPFIVPFTDDWLLHDPWPFGEHLVYDAADFDVNVKVVGADIVLAASAPAEGGDASSTHYHLEGARAFVLSASDSYQVDDSAVGSVKILAYHLPDHENANKAVVWMATQSLGLYQAKFGPYPYPSLSIVESDMTDGQEYDGLVFLASKFYSEYNGTAKSNLFTIGTHEISHQWWFGLVGDDQATEPWLDEALAVYSERIFYQYNYPNFGDWWWAFRVNYFGPQGYVDSSVYSFPTFRSYVNAVYLNGANFLDDLRSRIGDESFFALLEDYSASYGHGRATTADFFAVVRRHTNKDLSSLIRTYFQGQY